MIVTGLCLACLCGMAGFAVDVGVLFRDKRIVQTAADAGAIAGAAEYHYTDVTAAARAATALNGVTNGSGGATVTVNSPPLSGPHLGVAGYVEVIVTVAEPTFFMKALKFSTMNVSARSVAGLGPATGCIFTLDPSGIDIGMTGSGDLNMPSCGIVINSASSNALNLTGSATISAQSIGIVGGYHETGSGTITPTPVTGVAPVANPLAYLTAPTFTPASCLADPHYTGSTSHTIGPSVAGGTICYNGLSMTGSGSLTLNPGIYVINGALSMTGSGSLSGSGITIYLAPPNGSLSLTGSGALTVSAPTSGTYDGILFFEDSADTNAMTVTGSGSSVVQGIFYAPSASLSMTGSSGSSFNADLVVNALTMTGSGNMSNYATVNSTDPITSARVVE